jgi:hypothetical protein
MKKPNRPEQRMFLTSYYMSNSKISHSVKLITRQISPATLSSNTLIRPLFETKIPIKCEVEVRSTSTDILFDVQLYLGLLISTKCNWIELIHSVVGGVQEPYAISNGQCRLSKPMVLLLVGISLKMNRPNWSFLSVMFMRKMN